MEYDVERSKRESSELKSAFAEIFPLAPEPDLPWAACHIKGFLRKRIQREVEEATFHFTSRVCRILCEVSPPKNHVEDMARIVTEKAKLADERQGIIDRLKKDRDDRRDAIKLLTDALDESVKLQSHYAELLNQYDSGTRATFESGSAWVARLEEVRAAKSQPEKGSAKQEGSGDA